MTEFLFNPNVAYLLLVLCTLMALASILSPGTGFIELSTLVLFVLTAWVISNSTINWWALVILVAGLVPFWLAVRGPGTARDSRERLYLIAAIGAFVLGSVFLYTQPGSWLPAVHPLLGAGISILLSIFLWWATRRTIEALRTAPAHDVNRLIGAEGEARTDILLEGSVYVGGEMWSATSRTPIKANTSVRVISRSGLVLEVEEQK